MLFITALSVRGARIRQPYRLHACMALAVLALTTLPTPHALAGFPAPVSFDAGSAAAAVAVADFNGDGIPDLAVANQTDTGTVTILLGQGDGRFQPAQHFSAGSQPASLAVADFNADGILDLAVANQTDPGNVSILLGNGDGTFQEARPLAASAFASGVAVGDFNGDGIADLAVTSTVRNSTDQGSLFILLGNGDGTFQDALEVCQGPLAGTAAVTDFNGDGILDLAVTEAGTFPTFVRSVRVLLGRGDGTFSFAQNYPTGSATFFSATAAIAVGDLNRDGIADLAVINPADGTASVLLGQGNGSFRPAQRFQAGKQPNSVALIDFNGDGIPDLAVANDAGTVTILLGRGDGTFLTAQSYPAGAEARCFVVGDFNHDGKADLAVSNNPSSSVSVLLGRGDGSFPTAPAIPVEGEPRALVAGDFNRDGILDLAVADFDRGSVRTLGQPRRQLPGGRQLPRRQRPLINNHREFQRRRHRGSRGRQLSGWQRQRALGPGRRQLRTRPEL